MQKKLGLARKFAQKGGKCEVIRVTDPGRKGAERNRKRRRGTEWRSFRVFSFAILDGSAIWAEFCRSAIGTAEKRVRKRRMSRLPLLWAMRSLA
jgi:hypothetical protein